ncbi:MAG: diaminobutyrate--2-oxoglutarate transaminase [Proteobacteria bacterium]|nr:diaminobutyrate--2-oxoglutarate transaminase [Pseudomonadota bacterium]
MEIIERRESQVRSYCRSFPTVFTRAAGSFLYDGDGREYIDFFAGAGALSYGHNNPELKERLLQYIGGGGITHSLDMATEAKCQFLDALERIILRPRDLDYRVMFPGPTGTNAVEAALKLARKVTGRTGVVSFTNGFHGMTLGSLAVTGNAQKRGGAGIPLTNTVRMPFDGYFGEDVDTIEYMATLLGDSSSGVTAPAAFIVETVQAEGGVNPASWPWLERLQALAREYGALLIVDDIQVGCGRTGPFFSFEPAGLRPDIVCLSKSLSGFGLPLAVTLIRPDIDIWQPGEHNGTFRGNNHAFVTAAAALEHFWCDSPLSQSTAAKAAIMSSRLDILATARGAEVRGRGLIQGLVFDDASLAARISRHAFARGLVIETAGPRDEVLKLLPPLTMNVDTMTTGLDLIEDSIGAALDETARSRASRHNGAKNAHERHAHWSNGNGALGVSP